MSDFISKPFNPEELFQKIASYSLSNSASPLETNKVIELIASPFQAKVQQNGQSINIEQFINITGNNIQELQRLIMLTANAFAAYKTEFADALMVRDIESLRKISHKSNMVMNLLEANKVLNLIQESEWAIENKLSDMELSKAMSKLDDELDILIKELKVFVG